MVDMEKSIVESCDTYYYLLAREMGVNMMHDFMRPLGFGQKQASTWKAKLLVFCPLPSGRKNTLRNQSNRSGLRVKRFHWALDKATTRLPFCK
jgi:cell division protein FtsI/penicillin-binding protein 2